MEGCNQQSVEVLLKMHLVALDKFLKPKNGLSREEVELVTEEVFSKYGGMVSFADIHVVFRNAKLGKYGELYNNLSCGKIMKWFDDYVEERCEVAYEMNRQVDREKYGHSANRDGRTVLHNMGYRIGEDGRICIDKNVVAANNAKWKAEQERVKAEQKSKCDADNEYMRWKQKMHKEGKI